MLNTNNNNNNNNNNDDDNDNDKIFITRLFCANMIKSSLVVS